jgi:hypothetical protein
LKAYERQSNEVLLNCADTTVSLPDLENSIYRLRESALALHREQIDEVARKATGWDAVQGFPLRKLPTVPLIVRGSGGYEVEHNRDAIARCDMEKEANAKWVEDHGIEYLTKTISCFKCQQTFEAKTPCGGPHDHVSLVSCPNCKSGYKVEWFFDLGDFSKSTAEQF